MAKDLIHNAVKRGLTFVQRRIKQYRLKFVIIDIHTNRIIRWIK